MLVTSIMVLTAFPVLAAALLVLEIDRKLGAHVSDAASGGAIMWRHLFWFFGHPEVYIVAIPFGIATEILPVFSRKPLFVYKGMIAATMGIAGLSMTVWAHHMFTTGAVLLPVLLPVELLHRRADRDQVLQLDRHHVPQPAHLRGADAVHHRVHGHLPVRRRHRRHPASPPLDFAVSDTYFLVAHFHYVPFGTVVFTMFGGFYFWWPKFTGKKLNETLGKWHFWTLFISFWMTFLVMHWEGVAGLPRRVANYPYLPGYVTTLNQISSVGSFILGASTLFFLYNVYWTWRFGKQVTEVDPWGFANSLEWVTSCRRPGTTSPGFPGSGPNGPPSTCTTRTSKPAARQQRGSPPQGGGRAGGSGPVRD